MEISNLKGCMMSSCALFHFFSFHLNVLVVVSAPAASIMIKEVEQYKVKNEQQANSNIKSNKNICEGKEIKKKGVNGRHNCIAVWIKR